MENEVDVYTQRPRTPNDQYTVMTEEQIRNVKKKPHTFFEPPPGKLPWPPSQGLPREGDRYYKDRYCHVRSGGNARGLDRTSNILCVDYQIRPNDVPIAHDTCRGLASAKWGPQKTGDRTRSHFFGEDVESYTTIDMYRRPATMYTGRVVMDCGRPGDGYYTQRFPDRSSWTGSTAKLNCTTVIDSVYRKTFEDYDRLRAADIATREFRVNKWPEFSEYTTRYALRQYMPKPISQLERNRRHAKFGQLLQAGEHFEAERYNTDFF